MTEFTRGPLGLVPAEAGLVRESEAAARCRSRPLQTSYSTWKASADRMMSGVRRQAAIFRDRGLLPSRTLQDDHQVVRAHPDCV